MRYHRRGTLTIRYPTTPSFKNSIDPGHIAIFLRFVASSVFIRGYGVCHESTHGSYEEKVITCGMVAKLKKIKVYGSRTPYMYAVPGGALTLGSIDSF